MFLLIAAILGFGVVLTIRAVIDHQLAARQCGRRFGSIVTVHLSGGRAAADRFIQAAAAVRIPFCPSLGEICTSLSHPATTSHRGLSRTQRQQLGIEDGTIRLSLGIESPEGVIEHLQRALDEQVN